MLFIRLINLIDLLLKFVHIGYVRLNKGFVAVENCQAFVLAHLHLMCIKLLKCTAV
jgi:hypothetical protein